MSSFKQQLIELYNAAEEEKVEARKKFAEAKPFKVVRRLTKEETRAFLDAATGKTAHASERKDRMGAYDELDLTDGVTLEAFEVDRQHKDGNEVHVITSAGMINIYNLNSKRFITVLGARPGQIRRYFLDLGISWSPEIQKVIKKAVELVKEHNINNK